LGAKAEQIQLDEVTLAPLHVNEQNLKVLQNWAMREDLEDYFRYMPPPFMWNSIQTAGPLLQGHFWVKEGDRIVGIAGISAIDALNQKVELGVMIVNRPNKGLGAKALFELCNYVFNTLNYNKVTCRVRTERKWLCDYLEKLGFTKDGILRKDLFWKNEFHDEALYSLLKEEQ
jgi:RimJ/RimL family protein N-acetyltransferase